MFSFGGFATSSTSSHSARSLVGISHVRLRRRAAAAEKKHFWKFLSSRLDETASKIRLFDLHSHEIREAIRGANGSRLLPQSVLVAWREWKEERKPNNNNTRDEPTKLSRKWQKKIRENFSYWKQKKKASTSFSLTFWLIASFEYKSTLPWARRRRFSGRRREKVVFNFCGVVIYARGISASHNTVEC